jgi:CubicO group peptidase (beta-lactamase class C family)
MFDEVTGLLEGAVADGIVPGISVCVATSERQLYHQTFGMAELRPQSRAADNGTSWDLASLTKVMVTTPVAMAMVGDGRLSLDLEVRKVLPDAHPNITIAHLLSHSSGLPAWIPMVEKLGVEGSGTTAVREQVLRVARTAPLEAQPGTAYRYSDLGFMTLVAVLESVGGGRIDGLFEHLVRGPSGADLRWGWPQAAATEDCPIRREVVRGEVHDLNAWLMGGVSGHAGIFGSAAAVVENAAWQLRAWLGDTSQGLRPDVVRHFFGTRGAGSHSMGWDGVSPGGSAGPRWPTDGVGHLAFTGCSVWMAPQADLIVAMTSNRVHPEIEGGAVPNAKISPRYDSFRKLRPRIHTAVIDAVADRSAWPN